MQRFFSSAMGFSVLNSSSTLPGFRMARTRAFPMAVCIGRRVMDMWQTDSLGSNGCQSDSIDGWSAVARCMHSAVRAQDEEEKALRPRRTMLVRDFIENSLYNATHGYFNKPSAEVVGRISEPINWKALQGRLEYTQLLRRLYKERDSAWLTPVEIFKPWYGYAIAEYILRRHDNSAPLKIYEIGGGNGTCALNVLDYMKARAPPSVYRDLKYISVEISAALAECQKSAVHVLGKHRGKFTVERRNAMDREAWGAEDPSQCFVIMLEVLDNLPHDRICLDRSSGRLMETTVLEAGESKEGVRFSECLRPIEDPLVMACLSVMDNQFQFHASASAKADADQATGLPSGGNGEESTEAMHAKSSSWLSSMIEAGRSRLSNIISRGYDVIWVPSGAMRLLQVLYSARPNLSLIAADFTVLPDVSIEGKGAPLVASKAGGVSVDHSTYLVTPGSADIFFPTDFSILEKIDRTAVVKAQHERLAWSWPSVEDDNAVDGTKSSAIDACNSRDKQHAHRFRWSSTVSSSDFIEKFADVKQTETKSGFNPLLEDYSNTKFFLTGPR